MLLALQGCSLVARQRDSGSLAGKASCQNGHEMFGENLRIEKKNKDVILLSVQGCFIQREESETAHGNNHMLGQNLFMAYTSLYENTQCNA